MKIPNVIFVKHCPNLNPERKVFLQEHFKERCPEMDIRWTEGFNYDDVYIQWFNYKMKLPYGPKLTSNLIKGLEQLKTMVDENIESAFIMDDDVTLHKDWKAILESVDPQNLMFMNLGTSLFQPVKPEVGKIHILQNNGGCEMLWCTKEFAKMFLDNLNLDEAADIVWHGFLYSIGHPIPCVPIAHQTSMLVAETSLDHDTRKSKDWVRFVGNYKNSKKITYQSILQEFQEYLKLKSEKEKHFKQLYGKDLDIRRVSYVLGEDR